MNKNEIEQLSMNDLVKYISWSPDASRYFQLNPGQEHYKLLKYLSINYKGEIADIGTYRGASALALSANSDVHVTTYDCLNVIPDNCISILSKENITMKVNDCKEEFNQILKADIIFFDIDHTGQTETWFVNELVNNNYKGLLFLDDIYLNKEMTYFWSNIPSQLKKIDLTSIGHFSGTGVVIFDPSYMDVILIA